MSEDKKIENNNEKKKVTFGDIVDCIVWFLESRLFIAGLMIFLGIRVAINPSSAPDKIAWGLGLVILIATGGILIGYISTKSFNKKNLKSIIETFLFTALGVFLIIFSDVVGFVLEEIICVIIIINSIMNLVSLKDYEKRQEKKENKANKRNSQKDKSEVFTTVTDSIKDDFERYNKEFINAAKHVNKKAKATIWGQIILNVLFIIIAIVMMVTNFAGAEPIYFISGIVMVLSGLNEIVLLIREYMEKRREEIVDDLADDDLADDKE